MYAYIYVSFRCLLSKFISYSSASQLGCESLICVLAINRNFDMSLGDLGYLLQVHITSKHKIFTLTVFHGYLLEIFKVPNLINLISNTMGDVCEIVGMDWLNIFGVMIDCEMKVVVVQSLIGG